MNKDKDKDDVYTKLDESLAKKKSKSDVDRSSIHRTMGLGLNERIEMLERAILKPMRKKWGHPISVFVSGRYHQCAACGGEFEDEVVVVVERTRSGDHNHVFCSMECLQTHDWPV